jgi:hypothetical protein
MNSILMHKRACTGARLSLACLHRLLLPALAQADPLPSGLYKRRK